MEISRTTAYAIQATLQLGNGSPGVPVSCSDLAEMGALPKRFLLQILRRLVTQGILRSTRGADGGYFLARTPEQITLRDILEAFEKPYDAEVPALSGLSLAARSRVSKTLQDMTQAASAELAKLSVADLLRVGAYTADIVN